MGKKKNCHRSFESLKSIRLGNKSADKFRKPIHAWLFNIRVIISSILYCTIYRYLKCTIYAISDLASNILIMTSNKQSPLLFLLFIHLAFTQLLYSRRVSLVPHSASPTQQRQYEITYDQDSTIINNSTNNVTNLAIVLSLTSFTEGNKIGASVVSMKARSFEVSAVNVFDLSYLLVRLQDTWHVGKICMYFPPGIMPSNS